jgi:predicted transcriptional regulator
MKATIELDDSVFSEVEAYAEQNGKSVNVVLVEAISDKFAREPESQLQGLMSVFGTADHEAVAEVQRIIDEDFSKVG